jgi:nitrile hydratase beta subunit
MNGVHDMGGMQCFGPVKTENHEPIFHADWEKSALALTLAMGGTGLWNIDEGRSARESLPPSEYMSSSYYQIWLSALEQMMLDRGLITPEELKAGQSQDAAKKIPRVLKAELVAAALAKGAPSDRKTNQVAKFRVGQKVRTINFQPTGHTRLPRYVRGKVGMIVMDHGAHVLPDVHSKGNDVEHDIGEYLYTVVFESNDLWGHAGDPRDRMSVDAWESYLEAI